MLTATTTNPTLPGKAVSPSDSEDVIVPYDSTDPLHKIAFVSLLREQAKVHGINVPQDRAYTIAANIGNGFDAHILFGPSGRSLIAKGMTTTTIGVSAEGPVVFLEDLIVTKQERRKQYGTRLFNHVLLTAFKNNCEGVAWQTGRNNVAAEEFYKSIDVKFDPSRLLNVWELPLEAWGKLSKTPNTQPRAVLAVSDPFVKPLSHILPVIRGLPVHNADFLYEVMARTKLHGMNSSNFIVRLTKSPGFAIVSQGYSTFDGRKRADVRLYPERVTMSNHQAEKENFRYEAGHISDLIKVVSVEMAARRMTGAMYIEMGINVIDEPQRKAMIMNRELNDAVQAIGELGGKVLEHGEGPERGPMIGYHSVGERYIQAVIKATANKESALDPIAREQLKIRAREHNLPPVIFS